MNHPEYHHFNSMRNLIGDRKFKSVLDVGCGTGYLASFFLDCSECIHAVDKKKQDIDEARIKYPSIHFDLQDLETYSIEGKHDLVIFSDVIYYLTPATQDRIMKEIHDALTEGGILLSSRHMGKGDQEINQYNSLFQPILTEKIQNIETPSYWQATIWRKKESNPPQLYVPPEGELRDKEEVELEIKNLLSGVKPPFSIISILLWRLMDSRKQLLRLLDRIFQENRYTYTPEILAILWLLKMEEMSPDGWHKFQCSYHYAHPGDVNADFRAEIFMDWMGIGKNVLDVGIHTGLHTNLFAEKNNVIGVDFPEILSRFQENYKFKTCGCNVETEGLTGFPNRFFDVVVAGELIEHLLQPTLFFQEVARVLAEGGKFIGSCPYRTVGWQDPLHCQSVDEEKIKEWCGDLFTIKEMKILPDKGTIMFLAESNRRQ